ncbi:type VI secretion system baseplate subunit TssG [Limnoglobus roseus]|uniref:Type VI secretion system baseplate subunit TssG n=1 Tax=Limnoglobus roseus TaxID=2598579 RepID=A0A5C1AK16_9BACT|nr:type VI secretion system baseplate subunit TssG [Limnoglobus roseus]QEL19739.1 type VI secretion system baseplate subunit TssG [Limnoglobus roseus]
MPDRYPIPALQLFDPEECCGFDPFQAIRLLELLANKVSIRDTQVPWKEVDTAVRFRTNVTLAFPPSLIAQILPPAHAPPDPEEFNFPIAERIRKRYKRAAVATVVSNFFGLFGPNGALPLVYTQTLCDLDTSPQTRQISTRGALRDWFDLFNHRMTALLFKAWQKYRMPVGYLRHAWRRSPTRVVHSSDRITQVLFNVVGLGTPPLRDRLRVLAPNAAEECRVGGVGCEPLTRIDDRAILAYAGAFARRHAGAHELRAILADYFDLPIEVQSLTGQWLDLPIAAQTRLDDSPTGRLGINAIAGEKIWDAGSKFRLRIGPLRYVDFVNFLPDPTAVPERKSAYLLSQLTRLYVGAELDFEIELVLHNFEVPPCDITDAPVGELGLRLGWNTWLTSDNMGMPEEVDDVRYDAPCDVVLPAVQG